MTDKKTIDELNKMINKTFRKFTVSNRMPVKHAIQLGWQLNICKARVKKEKKSWETNAQENFPHIHERKRIKIMRIARLLDKDYPKSIHLIGITVLDGLCPLSEPHGIVRFLTMNGIKLKFKLTPDSVKDFQTRVTKLIQKPKAKKQSGSKPKPQPKPQPQPQPQKPFGPWLKSIEKKSMRKDFSLTPKNIRVLKRYIKTISEIIERAEGR